MSKKVPNGRLQGLGPGETLFRDSALRLKKAANDKTLFNNETLLAVANSNRFHANCECQEHPEQCIANVAFLDVSNPGSPTVQQVVNPYNPNPNSPDFPRNVTVGPDDSTLYVPNAGSMKLEVITTSVK